MPTAVSDNVADGLAAFFAAGEFSQEIEPIASYLDYALERTGDELLHVDVVATITKQKVELSTNGSYSYTVPIDVVIRKHLGEDKQVDGTGRVARAAVKEMMFLTQQLFEYAMPERLPDFDEAVWQATEILVAPNTKHLRDWKQFSAIVRITYEVEKDFE